MLSISIKDRRRRAQAGFTMIELMTAAVISLIVFAALFSAYIFIARNITRISFFQQQSVQSARILHLFSDDVSSATAVVSANNMYLKLQLPPVPPLYVTPHYVTYTYTYQSTEHGTLERVDTAGSTITLTGINPNLMDFSYPTGSNIFNYYDKTGLNNLLPPPTLILMPSPHYPDPPVLANVPNLNDIKQIELSYLSTDGNAANGSNSSGTKSQHAFVSSRVVLRNKPPFGQ
jgi:prepilin-type N-terminal cleavage/methylation domain-containing protein